MCMAIRITGKLSDEVYEVVNEFNKKIRRLARTGNYNLPSQKVWQDVLESAKTRADLNRELKYIKEFNKRGAEKSIVLPSGIRTTQYEYNIAKKRQALALRRTKARLKRIEARELTELGEKQGTYLYRMGDSAYENMLKRLEKLEQPLETNPNFKKYATYLESASLVNYTVRDKTYMDNFFNEMNVNLAYAVGFDRAKIDEMKKKIFSRLTDKQIAEMMSSEEAFISLSSWYNNIHRRNGLIGKNKEMVLEQYNDLYENLDSIIDTYAS